MDTQQTNQANITTVKATLDPATHMGLVSIAVADLERSLAYYHDALGFAVLARTDQQATLGAGDAPLLVLTEERGARPWPHDRYGYTGLYHFAILVPSRADLGRWLGHWLALGYPLPGQGDHLVSEALYLSDPDGNGIEIYRDRPRDEWRWINGQVQMATDPVDIAGVLAEAEQSGEPWTGMAPGTRLGHMHLQVGNIAQAEAFYHDVLGFDIVARMPTALFISAGGYHHHIGMNIWHSRGAGPAPVGIAGLRAFTIELPTEQARNDLLARVRAAGLTASERDGVAVIADPWRNTILLTVGAVANPQAAQALFPGATPAHADS
ncbi:MAG: VOC family protein [Ktedonobacterales bacterium]